MQNLKLQMRSALNAAFLGKSIIESFEQKFKDITKRDDFFLLRTDEICAVLKKEKVPSAFKRSKLLVVYNKKNSWQYVVGNDAKKLLKSIIRKEILTEIKGTIASVGKAAGIARVYQMGFEHTFANMQKGDILVASTTGPEFIVGIQKAAAIVTEEGGLMSHAAVLSREYKIPCIVGTKFATKVFKDGDLVEVDAEKGIVKKLK